ncbi:MAG: hypothetical protein RL394_844 [Bacteroidota bacterium]|jgi:hypothetical protein
MRKKNLYFTLAFLLMLSIAGCKKDPVVDPNESELITTVKVVLTEKVSGTQSIFEFKDLDGVGGAAPSKFDEIVLAKGKVYGCNLQLLNESKIPADDITLEVFEEGVDHQIYLTATDALVAVSNLNLDAKGLPLGISSTWTASTIAGTGTINITLKHKPGVKAAGDLVSVGDSDVSVDFKLSVK